MARELAREKTGEKKESRQACTRVERTIALVETFHWKSKRMKGVAREKTDLGEGGEKRGNKKRENSPAIFKKGEII